MNAKLRLIFSILWIVIGAALIVLNCVGLIGDLWFSFGFAMTAVGFLQLVRNIRYRTNARYREETDTAEQDERNRFLRGKAWSWAGYTFVMLAAVAVVVLNILGIFGYANLLAGCICAMILLYCIFHLIFSRKY